MARILCTQGRPLAVAALITLLAGGLGVALSGAPIHGAATHRHHIDQPGSPHGAPARASGSEYCFTEVETDDVDKAPVLVLGGPPPQPYALLFHAVFLPLDGGRSSLPRAAGGGACDLTSRTTRGPPGFADSTKLPRRRRGRLVFAREVMHGTDVGDGVPSGNADFFFAKDGLSKTRRWFFL